MQKNDTEKAPLLCPWFEELLLETPEDQREKFKFGVQSDRSTGEKLIPKFLSRLIIEIDEKLV